MDTIRYIDKVHKKEITIETKNLIKPQDLYKHIGERLIFHNGFGYIVSGILEKADKEFNSYQYDLYGSSDYSNELDISYFYCDKDDPDSIVDLEDIYYSLYVIKIQGMTLEKYAMVFIKSNLINKERLFVNENLKDCLPETNKRKKEKH